MGQSQTEPYYQSVAITIIVFNTISLLSLSFVLGIYIANWKKIASFPMRLVLTYLISIVILSLLSMFCPKSLCYPFQPYLYS